MPLKPAPKASKRVTRSKPWWVYMLLCRGRRIYTGATTDVPARFARHRAGKAAAFTRGFPPSRVLAAMRCRNRGAALRLEHRLKQLPPPEKLRWAARHAARMRLPSTSRNKEPT